MIIDFTITEPDPLAVTIDVTDPTCNGFDNGSAILTITGGTEPYDINGALENLSAGIDSLTITDAQGCVLDTTFQVGEPDLLEITNIDITNVTCNGESDGFVDITLNGGTPPYQFLDPTSGLAAGTYTINMIDAQECAINTEVIIQEPDSLEITAIDVTDATCFGEAGEDGAVLLTIIGGNPPYTILDFPQLI